MEKPPPVGGGSSPTCSKVQVARSRLRRGLGRSNFRIKGGDARIRPHLLKICGVLFELLPRGRRLARIDLFLSPLARLYHELSKRLSQVVPVDSEPTSRLESPLALANRG